MFRIIDKNYGVIADGFEFYIEAFGYIRNHLANCSWSYISIEEYNKGGNENDKQQKCTNKSIKIR